MKTVKNNAAALSAGLGSRGHFIFIGPADLCGQMSEHRLSYRAATDVLQTNEQDLSHSAKTRKISAATDASDSQSLTQVDPPER